jgi:hypothetical protein
MTYVGAECGLTYIEPFIRDRLFGDGMAAASSPRPAEWTGPDQHERLDLGPLYGDADLFVAALPWSAARRLPARRAMLMPFRVHLVTDFSTVDGDKPPSPSARERKRQRRRVRDHAYGYRISQDAEDFDWFYDRMHIPTMNTRHAERQRTVAKDIARHELFERGFLLLVTAGTKPVAGILCQVDDEQRLCNARLVGWLDGDETHLRHEALKTGNHFLVEWARDAGFRRIDFQGCEPFLSKGTFQSKRHLGVRAVAPVAPLDQFAVWVHARRDLPAIRDFLVANPPIQAIDGRLRPCYFFDALRPVRTDLGHECAGMSEPVLIDLDKFFSAAAESQ